MTQSRRNFLKGLLGLALLPLAGCSPLGRANKADIATAGSNDEGVTPTGMHDLPRIHIESIIYKTDCIVNGQEIKAGTTIHFANGVPVGWSDLALYPPGVWQA